MEFGVWRFGYNMNILNISLWIIIIKITAEIVITLLCSTEIKINRNWYLKCLTLIEVQIVRQTMAFYFIFPLFSFAFIFCDHDFLFISIEMRFWIQFPRRRGKKNDCHSDLPSVFVPINGILLWYWSHKLERADRKGQWKWWTPQSYS